MRTFTLTERGQAQFRFPLDRPLQEQLKATLPGVTWNGRDAWVVRTRAANIRAMAAFLREHDFAGAEVAESEQARLFGQVLENMVASRAGHVDDFTLPATLAGTLRPFQVAGVAYAARTERCLQGDEMGLGKTPQAISTLETLNAFPAVVVCPASLKLNWERELKAWVPHRRVSICDGDRCSLPAGGRPDVVIINYDILPKNVEPLRTLRLKGVVFDEAHLLKTHGTRRSVAARALRHGVKVRLLLTGTPVLNRPSELLELLTILGTLDDLGGFWHFVERYCGGEEVERIVRGGKKIKKWDMSGATNLPELAARLRATCMVRRRKKDVLPELPPKQLSLVPVSINTRKEYDDARKDVLKWIAKRAGKDPEFRAAIAHLDPDRQIAAILHRAQNAAERAAQAEELVRLEALKQISARGKLAAAEEWIGNVLADGNKLVVFAWHQEILDALVAKFPGAGVISGETPNAQRQKFVDAFQTGTASLILLNLQAGGVGLTLTAASNVLLLELPWTPALLDQAVDRCHRLGQRAAVNAWVMMGERTIDHAIWKLLLKKRQTTEAATR